MALGKTQQFREDYDQTYAQVARSDNTNVVFTLAASLGWKVESLDVCTAFLQSELESGRKVYLRIPEGVEVSETGNSDAPFRLTFGADCVLGKQIHYSNMGKQLTLRLKKSIYGLKQSPRQWYKTLSGFFDYLGFVKSAFDGGIFLQWLKPPELLGLVMIAVIHVDDVALVDTLLWKWALEEARMAFEKHFKTTNYGEITAYDGKRIERRGHHLLLDQCLYLETIPERFEMTDVNPISTPMEARVCYLTRSAEEASHPQGEYRKAIGSLIAAGPTRLDIVYLVGVLSSFVPTLQKPTG